jgi:hypothetical protein
MKTILALAALAAAGLAGCTPPWAAMGRKMAIEKASVQYNCSQDKIKVDKESIVDDRESGSTWVLDVCGTKRTFRDDGPQKRWKISAVDGK